MIVHLKENTNKEQALTACKIMNGFLYKENETFVVVNSSKSKNIPAEIENLVSEKWNFDNDMQLTSRAYKKETREVKIGNITIGGKSNNTHIIAGPCSVESKEQIHKTADFLSGLGLHSIRGGCYKPRTSPYSFQGLGYEGICLLNEVKEKYELSAVTEVKDSSHIDVLIENADIIQIGTKAMYDQSVLRKCGESDKPILLKRGFGTTLQEFVQAAEFIMSKGNDQVILCERGIRTFVEKTRFTLDLCGVAYLKEHCNLPIVLDPSHAMGYSYGVSDISRACVAMGIDGLLIEVHPNPKEALSDAAQQLNFNEFENLLESLKPIAKAVGKNII